jgi:outer membrane protein assembly factor BamB
MKNAILTVGVPVCCAIFFGANSLCAQDWPQWRGPDRTAKATGFTAPKEWPKELTQKWKVTVGDGVATPALVGDKLYVFSRESGNEVIRCLNAADGKEIWQDKYEAAGATGPASGFPGPRSSPTVVDGKVVTLGVQGTLSCYDVSGKKLWRKDDFKGSAPRFFVSSSPIVVDGLCIAQLGGENKGAIVAYDLATGTEKWKWTGDGTAYASPSLLISGGAKVIVAETAKKVVGVSVADGKLLWETPFAVTGRGYNSASPMVEGETVIYAGSGRGAKAVKMEKKGDELAAKELWSNKDNSVIYNTPVLKNNLLFGLSDGDKIFCINTETGKTAWTSESIGGKKGYGSIVDAGPVLFALTPGAKLIVFEPTDKEFKQLGSYKVGSDTYAYPIVSGNRIFIKDKDSLTLWNIPPDA